AVLALIGPELQPSGGQGGLRQLDVVVLTGTLAALSAQVNIRATVLHSFRRLWPLLVLVLWGAALWILHGAHTGPAFRTDVRLALLAAGTFLTTMLVAPELERRRLLVLGVTVVGILACLKVIAISSLAGDPSLAVLNRLQVNAGVWQGVQRTILIGGDTLV